MKLTIALTFYQVALSTYCLPDIRQFNPIHQYFVVIIELLGLCCFFIRRIMNFQHRFAA